nr:putative nuclease HARBI1 [Rhipicephalus microplus]
MCGTKVNLFLEAHCLPKIPRPALRDRGNPMELYNEVHFHARYLFTKHAVQQLLSTLPLQESRDNRGLPVPPMLQLLMALRFYGAGTFQTVTEDLVHILQSTVCRAVGKVTTQISKHLYFIMVHFPPAGAPAQPPEFQQVTQDFHEVAEFPGVTGCIDCTHVQIKSSGAENAEVFRNHKSYFSFNVQAVAGPQLQFDIVAGWPSSVHDSRIFDNSRLRVLYEENRVPGVLLGDAGYACHPYLFTPFSEPGPADAPKGRYQRAQIKTRNVVERAFGVWKRRFPCLDMGMQHKAKNIVHIITACAALHKLACLLGEPERAPEPCSFSTVATRTVHLPRVDRLADSRSGNQARDLLVRKSFT